MQSLPLHPIPTFNDRAARGDVYILFSADQSGEISAGDFHQLRHSDPAGLQHHSEVSKSYNGSLLSRVREVPKEVCEERLTLRCYEIIK